MAALAKSDILAHGTDAAKFTPVPVHVEELGGEVLVRKMRNTEADEYEVALSKCDHAKARGTILAYALCDESGRRLFLDESVGDLGQMSASATDAIIVAFREANKGARPKA